MPSNDEVVWALPQIQCPSCQCHLELNKTFTKYSKQQRKEQFGDYGGYAVQASDTKGYSPAPHREDEPSRLPDHTYIVTSCANTQCEQYNKVKVFEIPRIVTHSVKVTL